MESDADSSTLRERFVTRTPPRFGAVCSATGVALGGAIAGLVSALLMSNVYGAVASPNSALDALLSGYLVQPGMLALAGVYLGWRSDLRASIRVGVPTREGVGWILVGPFAYEALTSLGRVAVSAAGLSTGHHAAGLATWELLAGNPVLILPGTVLLFGVMAPAEELLYRGVLQAKLRDAFGFVGTVSISALLFGGMHFLLSGGVSSLLLTAVGGLSFTIPYERTRNLVVPILIHGLYWLTL
ncbi:CPBP family intramembrane glutamic endopeptidase [Halorussus salinus]|uniref:CPBP family intramembrane glutamic endopeptidase n=1 Tax=Halorussus salinus TaxID=1364935 RepID=UPI00109330D0|nr:type II CAAX endopeptidase family protein [Halorussus salinus]